MSSDIIEFRHRARLRPPIVAPTRAPASAAPPRMSLLGPCWSDPFLEEMKRFEDIVNPPWLKRAMAHTWRY